MEHKVSRRKVLAAGAATGAVAATRSLRAASQETSSPATKSDARRDKSLFTYCLNTSTISGQKLGIEKEIEIAAAAGFGAIEPWIREILDFQKTGGTPKDLARRIKDAGLSVPSAIGFAAWIVDDDAQRTRGMEEMKRDMDLVAQIGGKRIAAPAAGLGRDAAPVDLRRAAERYAAVCELGRKAGVTPMVEIWGPSKTLQKLGDGVMVAMDSGQPEACVLADVYHLYKGGTSFSSLKMLAGGTIPVFHFNDYPADPPREKITDAHRVFPGDGIAPIPQILHELRRMATPCVLSLELFNRDYWKRSPVKVAQEGMGKMRKAVESAPT